MPKNYLYIFTLNRPLSIFFIVEVGITSLVHLLFADKPPLDDLQYFLEFQIPRQWAPMFCELPLRHQRRKTASPSLQFSFMGPKLHIISTQVLLTKIPVFEQEQILCMLGFTSTFEVNILLEGLYLVGVRTFSFHFWLVTNLAGV